MSMLMITHWITAFYNKNLIQSMKLKIEYHTGGPWQNNRLKAKWDKTINKRNWIEVILIYHFISYLF